MVVERNPLSEYTGDIAGKFLKLKQNIQFESGDGGVIEDFFVRTDQNGVLYAHKVPDQDKHWTDYDVTRYAVPDSSANFLTVTTDMDIGPDDSSYQIFGMLDNTRAKAQTVYIQVVIGGTGGAIEEIELARSQTGQLFNLYGIVSNDYVSGTEIHIAIYASGTGVELRGDVTATGLKVTKAQAAPVDSLTAADVSSINTSNPPVLQTAKVGDATGETQISETGIRLRGGATMWKDMVMDLFGRRLTSNVGKVDYDHEELAIKFQSGGSISTANDRVGGNQQINHEFQVGTAQVFKPHIHMFQDIAGGALVTDATFTLEYRVQNNNAAKTTAWTTITATNSLNDVWDFTALDGTYNQLLAFPDITINCEISDTIQMRIARTDSNAGDVLAYFFDTHGAVDSLGSEGVVTKVA